MASNGLNSFRGRCGSSRQTIAEERQKKGGAKHDNLWNSSLSGSDVVLKWRSSRGWQITLYHKKKQMCALKPQAYMSTTPDHDTLQVRAIKLMIQVGKIRRRHEQDERREHCLSRQPIKQPRPRFSEERRSRIRKEDQSDGNSIAIRRAHTTSTTSGHKKKTAASAGSDISAKPPDETPAVAKAAPPLAEPPGPAPANEPGATSDPTLSETTNLHDGNHGCP